LELIDLIASNDALPLLNFIRHVTEGIPPLPEEKDFLLTLRAKLPPFDDVAEAMDSDRLREISIRIKRAISLVEQGAT
jgi:hypothetical protein